MATFLIALGLVLILEGLVFALAPDRVEEILRMLASLPQETRRLIGLLALTAGGILITLAAFLG